MLRLGGSKSYCGATGGGVLGCDVAGIRGAVKTYFFCHVSKDDWDRPTLEGITFPTLSLSQVGSLLGRFSLEEIHHVVMNVDGNKVGGQMGLSLISSEHFGQ